jgi:hypothetical protein
MTSYKGQYNISNCIFLRHIDQRNLHLKMLETKLPEMLGMSARMSHEQVHDNLHFHIGLCSSELIRKQ